MGAETLATALEREHREIDVDIEAYVAGVAAGTPDTEPLVRAMAALRRHIYLEEELLFPPLRDAGMIAPIFVMLREHGQMWRALDAMGAQLRDGVAGTAVADACQELAAQLENHNSKEEAILYSEADRVLAGTPGAELATFLATGELPAGWTCAKAAA